MILDVMNDTSLVSLTAIREFKLQTNSQFESQQQYIADSSMFTFTAAIRGFHIYHHSWTSCIGQQLPTERETDNPEERFAIAVVDVILQYS